MRVYTGHQVEDAKGAFFVFAKSRKEAIDFLANQDVEVDEHSLKVVRDPGAVLFRAGTGSHPGEVERLHFEGDLPRWSGRP